MSQEGRQGLVQSVDRALAILEVLAEQAREVSLKDLSTMVGLDPSTTHRLLQTLMARGFVRQEEGGRRYALGLRAFEVGSAVPYVAQVRQLARPVLQDLAARTEETANLAVRDGWNGVYVEQVPGPHFLRMLTEVGRVIPLHCTAVGKALLAGLTDEELEQYLSRARLTPCTPRSLTSPGELRQEIHWVRAHGYAIDDEEFEEGAKCVGAAVRDRADRVVAAVSVSGPSVRFSPERINLFIPLVRKAALEISRALGHQPALLPGL